MTDIGAAQPSEEELRAYLQQLRDADPGEVIAQAYTMLGTGAEVKLGRPDARTLIDAMSALTQATQGRVPAELSRQMQDGVARLQVAQVQLERQQPDEAGTTGPAGAKPPAGAPPPGAAPGREREPAQPAAEQPAERLTDRLWIPGRDRPPPR